MRNESEASLDLLTYDPFSVLLGWLGKAEWASLFFLNNKFNAWVTRYLNERNKLVKFAKDELCYVVGGSGLLRGYGRRFGPGVTFSRKEVNQEVESIYIKEHELSLMVPEDEMKAGTFYIEKSDESLKVSYLGREGVKSNIITTIDLPLLTSRISDPLSLDKMREIKTDIVAMLEAREEISESSQLLMLFREEEQARLYASWLVTNFNNPMMIGLFIGKQKEGPGMKLVMQCKIKTPITLFHEPFFSKESLRLIKKEENAGRDLISYVFRFHTGPHPEAATSVLRVKQTNVNLLHETAYPCDRNSNKPEIEEDARGCIIG